MSSRSGFNALVAEHQSMVARICASYERDRDLARELSQHVWFAIWRALPGYRAEASLKTFVARIAQFRAISHVAQRTRLPLSACVAYVSVMYFSGVGDSQAAYHDAGRAAAALTLFALYAVGVAVYHRYAPRRARRFLELQHRFEAKDKESRP